MPHYVQKYVIVHFIDIKATPVNFTASEWPLHITLLANFQVTDIDSFKHELAELSKQYTAFTVRANGEALFGPQQNVKVSLIEPSDAILALHNELLSMAIRRKAILDEPGFAGTGYRPHATIQAKHRLQDQEVVKIDSLSLVDMYPGEDFQRRQVIETYQLGTSQ